MKKYELTREAMTLLLSLVGYMALHVIAYEMTGLLKSVVYISMTAGTMVGMYVYIRNAMYWHMFIFSIIGMMTVFAGLDSIGPIL